MYHIKISNITVFDTELLKSLEHILVLPKGNICLDKKSFHLYLHILLHFIMCVKILFFLRLWRSRTSVEMVGALLILNFLKTLELVFELFKNGQIRDRLTSRNKFQNSVWN